MSSIPHDHHHRRAAWLLLAAVGAGCTDDALQTDASEQPATQPAVHRVSGADPLPAGCGLPPDDDFTLFTNSEVQPQVAQDPRNPHHLVAIYQQDRWNRFGSNGAVTATSDDDGQSWRASANAPAFSRCTGGTPANGGDYDVTTDHWITIAPTGTAIAVAFSLSRTGETTAILASRSTDGGRHWQPPVTLQRDTEVRFFNDRPTVTADPFHPGRIYVAWDRIDDTSTADASHFTQPLMIARSEDDGTTWGPATLAYDTPVNSGTIGDQISVLPDGALLNVFRLEALEGDDFVGRVNVIRSTDGGHTWSAPTLDFPVPEDFLVPDPDGIDDPLRNASLPLLAVQPGTQIVNAVWQSTAFTSDGTLHVAFAQSRNGGQTWSAPVRIDRTPVTSALVPTIAVLADGTIAVSYYDSRNNTSDPATLPTDLWAVQCARRCSDAAAWTEQHLAGPFDARLVPRTSIGRMLGDYTGLVAAGRRFVAVYGVATSDASNPTEIRSTMFAAR